MTYAQYRAFWAVPGGGLGITNFHTTPIAGTAEGATIANLVQQFFIAIRTNLPNDVTISFDSEVTVHNDQGELTATYPVTPPASTVGGQTGGWAGAAGARIDWLTGIIVAGRRLRGRTYIVPLASTVYDNDGTLTTAFVNTLTAAANGLADALELAGLPLVVVSRTHQTQSVVTGQIVNDKTAILRSRRD